MNKIRRIQAREVLDSRGTPTVEAEVELEAGAVGRGIAPSGASTGKHEALELRDGDPARYGGRGVRRAVANVREVIAPALVGRDADDQAALDRHLIELDGTPNKARLGANAILAVSLAAAHAAATTRGLPLYRYIAEICPGRPEPLMPVPMVNILSGGLHVGHGGKPAVNIQDFLFVPTGAPAFSEALERTVRVHSAMRALLEERGFTLTGVADEGGYAPALESIRRGLDLMVEAATRARVEPRIALDIAASHFFRDSIYQLQPGEPPLTSEGMVSLLTEWHAAFPIASIEDGLAEDDWSGWKSLTARLGGKCQLIGDDLFATNPQRLERGIREGAANAVLVKMNQIGTITETLAVIAQARAAGYRVIVSARSGETEDDSLADLAVGSAAGQIKIGSVTRSERLAKYNRLLRIEEELGRRS